jgi:hypothetical protein
MVIVDFGIAIRAVRQRNFPALVSPVQPKECTDMGQEGTAAFTARLSQGSLAQALQHLFQRIRKLIRPVDGCGGGHFFSN